MAGLSVVEIKLQSQDTLFAPEMQRSTPLLDDLSALFPQRTALPARPSDAAVEFLRDLDPHGRHTLWAKLPDGYHEGKTFEPDSFDQIADWLDARIPRMNLYYGLNEASPDAPRDGRLSEKHIGAIRAVAADIDPKPIAGGLEGKTAAEVSEHYDLERARILGELAGLPTNATPSIVIDSGGGVQAVWLLDKTPAIERRSEAKALSRVLRDLTGGDDTLDVAHVFRLPGTINHLSASKRAAGRQPRPATVISGDVSLRYSLDALSSALPRQPSVDFDDADDNASRIREVAAEMEASDFEVMQSLAGLDVDLRDRVLRYAETHTGFGRAIRGESDEGDDISGSGYRARLVRAAYDLGFAPGEYACIAHALPHCHGANPVDLRAVSRDWVNIGEKHDRDLRRIIGDNPMPPETEAHAVPSAADAKTPPVWPTPYSFPDPRSLPPRQWLYPPHLIRKYLSCTVAAGGIGKSSLLIAEMLAMASGKPLLGVQPTGPLRVWYFNAEDPQQEIDMRIAAAIQHFGLTREDLDGRLFTDSGREAPLVIAGAIRGGATIHQPVVEKVVAAIVERQVDVMQVDPFVSTHRIAESSNDDMDLVAKEWSRIADRANAAIDLVHHTRKTGGAETTVEDSRGAIALINAARSARALVRMTAPEAAKLGVAGNHRRYLRIGGDPKNNLAPPSATDETKWFELISVHLMNGGGDGAEAFMKGDSIGVVAPARIEAPQTIEETPQLERALAAIRAGEWRADARADNWVGRPLAEAYGLDADDKAQYPQIKSIIANLRRSKLISEVQRQDATRHWKVFVEATGQTVPQSPTGSVFD